MNELNTTVENQELPPTDTQPEGPSHTDAAVKPGGKADDSRPFQYDAHDEKLERNMISEGCPNDQEIQLWDRPDWGRANLPESLQDKTA